MVPLDLFKHGLVRLPHDDRVAPGGYGNGTYDGTGTCGGRGKSVFLDMNE